METREKLFELIKVNSTNEDFILGDALLEVFPIDYIKNSELSDAAISICYEKSQSLRYDIITAILALIDFVNEGLIVKSHSSQQEVIGSDITVMRLCSEPEHCQVVEIIPTSANVWEILCSHYKVD